MPDISTVFASYQAALLDLGTTVQSAYDSITAGMIVKLTWANTDRVMFINVASKQAKYSNSIMYDFDITGKILEFTQLNYGTEPKIAVSYKNSTSYANILTKNTPEATDDPVTAYSLSQSEATTQINALLANFELS